MRDARICSMCRAPAKVQVIPLCFMRAATTFLQLLDPRFRPWPESQTSDSDRTRAWRPPARPSTSGPHRRRPGIFLVLPHQNPYSAIASSSTTLDNIPEHPHHGAMTFGNGLWAIDAKQSIWVFWRWVGHLRKAERYREQVTSRPDRPKLTLVERDRARLDSSQSTSKFATSLESAELAASGRLRRLPLYVLVAIRKPIWCAILVSLWATTALSAQDCNREALSSSDKERLFLLHEYSLLQEWAFHRDRAPAPMCLDKRDKPSTYELSTPDYSALKVVTLRQLDRVNSLFDIFESNANEIPYATVYREERIDGQERYLLSCRREEAIPELAIDLRFVGPRTKPVVDRTKTGDEYEAEDRERDSFMDTFDVFLDVSIAIPKWLMNVVSEIVNDITNELNEEQIETVYVSRAIDSPVFHDGHNEQMYLVRGTNFGIARLYDLLRLRKELEASRKYMTGKGCVFPVVSKVVGHVSKSIRSTNPVSFNVIGHSLGGTAAQFIAADRHQKRDEYSDQFAAYAFNGIGLQDQYNVDDLISYLVRGDWFGKLPGSQVGTVVTYDPMDSFWKRVPPFARHTIEGVQDSLCRCWEQQMGYLDVR